MEIGGETQWGDIYRVVGHKHCLHLRLCMLYPKQVVAGRQDTMKVPVMNPITQYMAQVIRDIKEGSGSLTVGYWRRFLFDVFGSVIAR